MDKEIKELVIENFAQTQEIIDVIESNFAKNENEQASIVVKYSDSISVEDLLNSLKSLWQYETNSDHTLDILIKNLSYEHRKEALRAALQNVELKDPIFLMNVFCLVKGYNTFSDDYFEHEHVFLNDEVEFLDIFDDLEVELNTLLKQIAEYYVSMLKTCNLTEGVENNPNCIELKPLFEYIFGMVDVTILAKVLSSVKDPSIWETKKIIFNGLSYLSLISEKFVFTNTILDLLGTELLKASVETGSALK